MGGSVAYKQSQDDTEKPSNWFSPTQIRDVIKQQDDRAREQTRTRLQAIFDDHLKRGLVRNGITLRVGIEVFEEQVGLLIDSLVRNVAPLSQDQGAFTLIAQAVEKFLAFLDDELEWIIEKVDFEIQDSQQLRAFSYAAKMNWAEKRDHLLEKVAERRSQFMKACDEVRYVDLATMLGKGQEPAPESAAAPTTGKANGKAAPKAPDLETEKASEPANGSVAAAAETLPHHWHAMWAHVAIQLYSGKLRPGCLADIVQCMTDWFASRDMAQSDDEIQAGAKQLWRKFIATQRVVTRIDRSADEDDETGADSSFDWLGGAAWSNGRGLAASAALPCVMFGSQMQTADDDAGPNGDRLHIFGQPAGQSVGLTAAVFDID